MEKYQSQRCESSSQQRININQTFMNGGGKKLNPSKYMSSIYIKTENYHKISEAYHIVNEAKLEWLSRDNLSSLPFAFLTFRHVNNWFTHFLDRSQITACLDSNLFLIFISVYDINTSQVPFYCLTFKCDFDL